MATRPRARYGAGLAPLESHLAYHLRCMRADATDPALSSLGRLALLRDRAARIGEIRQKMAAMKKEAKAEGVRTQPQGDQYEIASTFRKLNASTGSLEEAIKPSLGKSWPHA
jgi:hypothetical protein